MRNEASFLFREATSELIKAVCIPGGCEKPVLVPDGSDAYFVCPQKSPSRTLSDLLKGCANATSAGRKKVITLVQYNGSYY